MISDDKFIELLVAGINRQLIPNADVEWNAIRHKRQFDVLANIRVGPHNILIAYEVKNKNKPISVETLDAIVTKAKDLGAQKAVVVSTSGFQSGCIDVASRHSVDLFKLSFKDDVALSRRKARCCSQSNLTAAVSYQHPILRTKAKLLVLSLRPS